MPFLSRRRQQFKSEAVIRVEIRPGFGRWYITYIVPLILSFFAVLLVGLGLTDWLPRLLGTDGVGPDRLLLVSAVVFVVTYVALVLIMKRDFRVQDSRFSE